MLYVNEGNDKPWEATLRQADNKSILSNKSRHFDASTPKDPRKRNASQFSEALERKIDAMSVRSRKSLKSIVSNRSKVSAGSALKNLSPEVVERLEGREHKARIGCSTTHSHSNYKHPKAKKEP